MESAIVQNKISDIQAFATLELIRLCDIPVNISFELWDEYYPCLKQFLTEELSIYLSVVKYPSDRLKDIYEFITGEVIELKHFEKIKPWISGGVLGNQNIYMMPEVPKPVDATLPTIEFVQPKNETWLIPNFEGLTIPREITLDATTKISDVKFCIDTHTEIVTANNGKATFKPYLERLNKIHSLLIQN